MVGQKILSVARTNVFKVGEPRRDTAHGRGEITGDVPREMQGRGTSTAWRRALMCMCCMAAGLAWVWGTRARHLGSLVRNAPRVPIAMLSPLRAPATAPTTSAAAALPATGTANRAPRACRFTNSTPWHLPVTVTTHITLRLADVIPLVLAVTTACSFAVYKSAEHFLNPDVTSSPKTRCVQSRMVSRSCRRERADFRLLRFPRAFPPRRSTVPWERPTTAWHERVLTHYRHKVRRELTRMVSVVAPVP